MLNIVAALFVVFGLIGLFAFILRYMHSKGKLSKGWIISGQPGVVIENSMPIDDKRNLVVFTCRDQRYVFMFGPNNDVLLESSSVIRAVEQRERQHA